MKSRTILLLATVLGGPLASSENLPLAVSGTPDHHELTWSADIGLTYTVLVSPDLQNWLCTGFSTVGAGDEITFVAEPDNPIPADLYYQVRGAQDSPFLVLPAHCVEVDLEDGVCFSFDLDQLPSLPDKIRIWTRDLNSGNSWDHMGTITDMVETPTVRFVRGPAVWIPSQPGQYEISVDAVDDTGSVIAVANRIVIVGHNQAPTITIDGQLDNGGGILGPSPIQNAFPMGARFTTTVTDPEGDEIRRVEFFDNGELIGTDFAAPFGEFLEALPGHSLIQDIVRLTDGQGNALPHNITAKAYDARGAVGETAVPWVVTITDDNRRPELAIVSPPNGKHTLYVSALDNGGQPTFSDNVRESYTRSVTIEVRDGAVQTFAEKLVANVLDENTVQLSNGSYNARYTGAHPASGEFENGLPSGLEINSGVLLTSGAFEFWDDGDSIEEKTESWFLPGDLPDCSDIIAANTVHPFIPKMPFSQCNLVDLQPQNEHLYLGDDTHIAQMVVPPSPQVEYDGMTIRLRLHVFVELGSVHDFRFVIADVDGAPTQDAFFDSGLFVEETSVHTAPPAP